MDCDTRLTDSKVVLEEITEKGLEEGGEQCGKCRPPGGEFMLGPGEEGRVDRQPGHNKAAPRKGQRGM